MQKNADRGTGRLLSPIPLHVSRAVCRGLLIVISVCALSAGCGKKVQPKTGTENLVSSARSVQINGTRILYPSQNQQFKLGESIPVKLERISDTLPGIDSIQFFMDGTRQHTSTDELYEYACSTENLNVGARSLRAICYYADGRKEYHDVNITLLSDVVPPYLHYTIVQTWPHDRKAYTQGLVYDQGFLYEGTGQLGESSLRKTEITTGQPLRMLSLPGDVFGEGITIMDDKIYQLTYKSQVGFVYEKESFRRIQKVYYDIKEGWGITHDGQNLIMSDGSNRIYYMDPEYFTEVRQMEVYNDKGPVRRLNELEYIDGRIFANIYGEEEIVIIDPEQGRVIGKLNMKGILPEEDRQRGIDVFNGIAWNPEKRVLYVTGKYWPKLFEISLEGGF